MSHRPRELAVHTACQEVVRREGEPFLLVGNAAIDG